jgi:hypothetical protein
MALLVKFINGRQEQQRPSKWTNGSNSGIEAHHSNDSREYGENMKTLTFNQFKMSVKSDLSCIQTNLALNNYYITEIDRIGHNMRQKHRPLGVTILVVFTIIAWIYLDFIVLLLFIANNDTILAAVIGALSIPYLVAAHGSWKGKHWAWTLTLLLSLADIAVEYSMLTIYEEIGAILGMIVPGIVIYHQM